MLLVGGAVGALAQWLGTPALLVVLALMALAASASASRLPEVE
jgi:hypothetical protein